MADYRGDQYLFQGLQNLGQGAAKNIEEHQAEKQRVLDNAKISDMVFKVNPELLQGLGMPPEDYQSLSARDRTNLAGGVLQAMGYKRGQADERRKQDLTAAQIGSYEASANASEAYQTRANDLARGLDTANKAYKIWSDAGIPRTPEERMNKLMEIGSGTGLLGTREYDNLIESLMRYGDSKSGLVPGTASDIPGVQGHKFVALSRGSGTVIRNADIKVPADLAMDYPWITTADPAEFDRNLATVQDPKLAKDILIIRARVAALHKGAPDLSQFETDAEGRLTPKGYTDYLLSSKLNGVYPGMAVQPSVRNPVGTQPAGPKPASGLNFNDFQNWKATR